MGGAYAGVRTGHDGRHATGDVDPGSPRGQGSAVFANAAQTDSASKTWHPARWDCNGGPHIELSRLLAGSPRSV
jgi:hypothetical protein